MHKMYKILASNFKISQLYYCVNDVRKYKFTDIGLNGNVYLYEITFEDPEDKLQDIYDNYKVVDVHWVKDDIISIELMKADKFPHQVRRKGIIMASCDSPEAAILNSFAGIAYTFTDSEIYYDGKVVRIMGKRIKNNFKRMIAYKEKLYLERIRPYDATFVKVVNGEYDPDN